MKNKLFVLGALGIAVFAFIFLKALPERPVASQSKPPPPASVFVRSHNPVFGNALGRVTVVEWFDPECESCRMIHPTFKKIVNDYKDRVRFVLRYMPYHGNSMYAASALEEARELGKFDEALDLLFEKQPEWGDHHQPRPELIPDYLASLGIPREKLEKEYLLKKHSEKIRLDESDGNAAGVRGTPTFFINERMVPALGEEPLRAAIDEALN